MRRFPQSWPPPLPLPQRTPAKFSIFFSQAHPSLSRLRQQGPGLFQQPFAVNNGVAAPLSVAEYASFAVQLKEPGSMAVDAYDLHRVLPRGGEGDTTPQHMLPSLPRRTPAGFSTFLTQAYPSPVMVLEATPRPVPEVLRRLPAGTFPGSLHGPPGRFPHPEECGPGLSGLRP